MVFLRATLKLQKTDYSVCKAGLPNRNLPRSVLSSMHWTKGEFVRPNKKRQELNGEFLSSMVIVQSVEILLCLLKI